jgi:hypothetical protein
MDNTLRVLSEIQKDYSNYLDNSSDFTGTYAHSVYRILKMIAEYYKQISTLPPKARIQVFQSNYLSFINLEDYPEDLQLKISRVLDAVNEGAD